MKTIEKPERRIILPPLPEVDDATRREFLIGAAGLLLLPAGCGSDEDDGGQASGERRTITDAAGNRVEVPASPRHVVALTEQDVDAVLALDTEPAGITDARGRTGPPSYLGDRADGIPSAGTLYQPSLEKVAELDPDELVLRVEAPDAEKLDRVQGIAGSHLEQFGKRDGLTIGWIREDESR